MLHKKLFYVKPKVADVARKSVSCRQKQDDAAQKNYFVLKKFINFFQNSTLMRYRRGAGVLILTTPNASYV